MGNANGATEREETIRTSGALELKGNLAVPRSARGIVVFAHGSGSSRFSPRNRHVARVLEAGGLATLLVDLLTENEEREDEHTAHLRFDVHLLAERLASVARWVERQPALRGLLVGYFGASTGAAAALIAAARNPKRIGAIVSRGGRPDLAADDLPKVKAPTLLIVGGEDATVLELNRLAYQMLGAEKHLDIVPDAGHLFEEPEALDRVALLARDWFTRHLDSGGRQERPSEVVSILD